jgi:hypothetical protein
MRFIIHVLTGESIYELPYAFEYEGKKGFIYIDYKKDVVFTDGLEVISVEHIFDDAEYEGEPPIPPPVIPPTEEEPEEVVFATWSIASGALLITKITGNTKWLVQTNANRDYYVPRGKNFLERHINTISYIDGVTIDLQELSNEPETFQGGDYPSINRDSKYPIGWNLDWWESNGYVQNNIGEWVLKTTNPIEEPCKSEVWTIVNNSIKCIDNIIHQEYKNECGISEWRNTNVVCETSSNLSKLNLTSKTENQNNTFDFSNDFKNSWDYSKFKAIAGFQNYVFRGQVGLLEHFKAGWSHLEFQSYYPTSQSLGEKSAARFSMLQWFIENSNINGVANGLPSEFSALKNAILSRDFLTANQQSHEAWEMLGAQLSSHLLMYKDIQSGADKFAGVCLLDEESKVHLSANGGGPATLQFIAKVCQYVTLKTANSAVIHYGYPANSVHWSTDMWYKDTNLNSCKTELPMAVAKPSFDYYFDGTTTYCKSPLPVSSSLYKKDGNGNYIVSGGKRVLRTDPFSEYFGGIKNTWHPSFYNPYNNNYDPIYDKNKEIIGGGIISTITGVKVTDIEYAVAFSFRYVSLLKLVMGTIANQEGGGFDITRYYNSVYKPIAVMNTLTEPFTTGGNGFFRRWIGEEQLKFLYLAPLFAGYDGIYNYEDGFLGTIYYNPDFGNPNNLSLQLPTKGNKIAPWWFFENYQDFNVDYTLYEDTSANPSKYMCNQNLSRFNWITTAVSKMRDIMNNYTKNNSLRFAFFNPIGGGINNREVIILGMYQGNNMHLLCYYPFSDPTDNTPIKITIKGIVYNEILTARKSEILYLHGDFNTIEPKDIIIEYRNVDNNLIRVTGDINYHTA